MNQSTHPEFKIECPDCDVTYESHQFEDTKQFIDKHEEHTGHNAEWVRADFELVEPNTEWRVLCMECDEAWWFETKSEARDFQEEHAQYTDHEITTSITTVKSEIPEVDEVDDTQSVKELIERLENLHDEGAPKKHLFAHLAGDETTIAEARYELEKLKQKGEVYEPRTGYLRTT